MNARRFKEQSAFLGVRIFSVLGLIITVQGTGPLEAWSASQTIADRAAETTRTTVHVDIAGQVNPDGIMLSIGGFRRRIWSSDSYEGFPTSYMQTGLGMAVTPAYAKASVHGEWMPAIFARLRVEYDLYRFFGQYGALLSFPSAESPFGKREIEARKGQEESAWGGRALLQPTLFAKIGKVIVSNQTDIAYYRFNGAGPFFLEWEYDTLVGDGDIVAANRTQFLLMPWRHKGEAALFIGPYYETVRAREAERTRQRIGGVFYWVPVDELNGFSRPRVYSQLGVNLQDKNRNGEMYVTIGLGVDVDL